MEHNSKCPVCNSENTRVLVPTLISVDPKNVGKMNKSIIADRSTKVLQGMWHSARLMCNDCRQITDYYLDL